jgi:hypothetical protein
MRFFICLLVSLALFCAPLLAQAGEIKLIGTVEHIKLTDKNAKQAGLVIKDKGGKIHKVTVSDAANLDKIKDHRITEGDTVRMKYDEDSKNVTYLRKTAGC